MDRKKPPIWYWIISIPLALFALLGLTQIYPTLTEEIPEPFWAKIGYVIGILGFFIGAIFLILRKKKANLFFIVSIIGFLSHRIWIFGLSDITDTLEPIAPITLFLPIVISLMAMLIVRKGEKDNWIVGKNTA